MKYTVLASLFIAAATAGACSQATESTPHEQAAPLEVTTTTAVMTDRPSTFETGGIVRARLSATIASRVMAPVTAVHVVAGDRVRRGAPLVELDAREMRAHRERGVSAATAAEQSAVAADADVAAAQSGLTLARATHQRIADLAAKRSATPQELDQATAALSAAEAQLRSAEARRAAAAAGRDAANAASAAADTSLSYTRLTAPFDAIVSQRAIDPGSMATPGAPLLVLEDPASFRVEAMLDESRAAQVQLGSEVELSLTADGAAAPASWIAGRVTELARLDPASHAFMVKVDVPANLVVRSGSFARLRVTGPSRQALTIPAAALLRRGQLAFVYVVDAGQVARLRAVSTGALHGDQVEVLAGLSDGDMLVASPQPALTDGHPVRTTGAAATAARTPVSGVAR